MRAVSTGYGGTDVNSNALEPAAVSSVPIYAVPEPEEVAEAVENTKRSSRVRKALTSVLGAVGLGAAALTGL